MSGLHPGGIPRPQGPQEDSARRFGLLVALDPGKRKAGLAVCYNGVLLHAGTVTTRDPWSLPPALWNDVKASLRGESMIAPSLQRGLRLHIVQEDPQDYPGKPRRAEDLDSLRACNDRFWQLAQDVFPDAIVRVHRYTPRAWKGGLPKEVHHRRIERALAVGEPWPEGYDARDAVGLALFHLGRITRGAAR